MTDVDTTKYFSTFLAQHRRGELDAEIAQALIDVTDAAAAHGAPRILRGPAPT